MATVKANIGKELYRIEITSPTGNVVMADESIEKGGQDKGFSPFELLASSLAACTCATLRSYADHKGIDLQKVNVEIIQTQQDGKTIFNRKLQLIGNFNEAQRTRMLQVANACPVHRALSGPIEINTQLI